MGVVGMSVDGEWYHVDHGIQFGGESNELHERVHPCRLQTTETHAPPVKRVYLVIEVVNSEQVPVLALCLAH